MVDALTTGIIWIAVGAALVVLIHEQSVRLAGFSRAHARRREQIRSDIRDVCHDEECVALYESVAASVPDAVLYFALADTSSNGFGTEDRNRGRLRGCTATRCG